MPLTCVPHLAATASVDGTEGLSGSAERAYTIIGTENESTAIAKAATVAPATITVAGGIASLATWKFELIADDVSVCTATYKPEEEKNEPREQGKPPPAAGEWEFRLSPVTRGTKLHFARAVAKVAGKDGGPNNPGLQLNSFNKAIAWDGKKINGAEWPTGHTQIVIRSYFLSHRLTVALAEDFNQFIGYINNNDNWLGFYSAGEARYLGSNFEQAIPYKTRWPSRPVAVDFTFEISRNGDVSVPGLSWAGTTSDTTSKKGWQMLDVYSENLIDPDGIPIPTPRFARILDIGPETNFATAFAWNASNRRGAGVPPPP
jgi:hypothetical protein